MAIDWETLLGAEGADLQDAYDDCIAQAYDIERRYGEPVSSPALFPLCGAEEDLPAEADADEEEDMPF